MQGLIRTTAEENWSVREQTYASPNDAEEYSGDGIN